MKKYLINLCKIIIVIVVFYFIGKFFFFNLNELREISFRFNYFYFVLAVLIFCIFVLFQAFIWHFITLRNKTNISFKKSVIAWVYSSLAKYIPGKLFLFLGMIYFYHIEKKSKKQIGFCFFFEVICYLVSGIFIFLLSILFVENAVLERYRFLSLSLIIGLLIFVQPKVLNFLIKLLSKLFKKNIEKISIKYKDILVTIFFYVLAWLVLGVGFYFLVNSVYSISLNKIFFLTGALSLSIIIGMLSMLTPSGLGVREGILIIILATFLPNSLAVIISLLARLWTTLGDALSAAVVFVWAKLNRIKFGE